MDIKITEIKGCKGFFQVYFNGDILIGKVYKLDDFYYYFIAIEQRESSPFSSQKEALESLVEHFSRVTWKVVLPSNHPNYQSTFFKRRYMSEKNYTVVIVNPGKLVNLANDPYQKFIHEIKYWDEAGISKMVKKLDCSTGVPEMPIAHFNNYKFMKKKWFSKILEIRGYISFTNGRHRSRYLHDIGVSSFPVEMDNESVELINKYEPDVLFNRDGTL